MCWAKAIWITIGTALVWLITDEVVFAQCAMCKIGLVNSPEGQKMAGGFNTGILVLVIVPFLVVGALALLILDARRRHEQQRWEIWRQAPFLRHPLWRWKNSMRKKAPVAIFPLRVRAEINSHFGASAEGPDARRRDAGDVGVHRRGSRAKLGMRPLGCGRQAGSPR